MKITIDFRKFWTRLKTIFASYVQAMRGTKWNINFRNFTTLHFTPNFNFLHPAEDVKILPKHVALRILHITLQVRNILWSYAQVYDPNTTAKINITQFLLCDWGKRRRVWKRPVTVTRFGHGAFPIPNETANINPTFHVSSYTTVRWTTNQRPTVQTPRGTNILKNAISLLFHNSYTRKYL